ncbi:hypothetical protein GALL_103140 [mine drainage metagenome]|uniref:Uncharacterized protein n=1 Tax=mine drainage metagenome TaxID=410659 RepID=A0A1J5SGT3_9ZZZZ
MRLPTELLASTSEKKLELNIQQLQSILISYADMIVAHHNLFTKSYTENLQLEEVYKSTLSNIEHILSFIEKQYKQYFNLNQKVPDNYLLISRSNIKASLKKLKAHFISEGLDNNFIQIILYPYLRLLNNTNVTYTYRDLIYIKKLLAYQQEILSASSQNLKDQLIESLFYFNCNSKRFYPFYVNMLSAEIEAEQSVQQKIIIISRHLKLINQFQQKPGYSFNPKAISVREQVSIWLEEELIFVEKQMKTNQLFSIPHQPTTVDDDGINVSFTVKELAMFAQLMMESGIIYNKSKIYVAQKIVAVFRTKENHIQPHSLSQKMYLKEEHTLNSIKNYLIKMINHINKIEEEE